MKKVLKIVLVLSLLLGLTAVFAACNRNDDDGGVRVALVAHSPESILNDGSFNQGAWNGIQRFLASHEGEAQFFQPTEASDAARVQLMRDAINDFGANVLVLPGFHFVASVYEAQDQFPDVKFILLDASPAGTGGVRIQPNVAAVHYAEEEAGFLAGYAIVMEGHRNLGFMGGIPVPAVVRFGHGFIQGANFAASELDLEAGEVNINFHYLGSFQADPAHMVMASAWFAGGTTVIFAAAGQAGGSVMNAADANNGLVIGVDVDQSHLSPTVITSAMKGVDVSVHDLLVDFANDNFNGGRELMFNAQVEGIGLPMRTSRFANFNQAQYDAVFNRLRLGATRVSNSQDLDAILANAPLVTVNP